MTAPSMFSGDHPLHGAVATYHARSPQRTWSLIVSFLGDAVLPRGGSVGASAIGAFCAIAGIEPGLVRTALSRLVARRVLARERQGRNSFYRLTELERSAFSDAADLIYGRRLPVATGAWDLVTVDAVADRAGARAMLMAQGFAAIGAGTFLRPEHCGRDTALPPDALPFRAESANASMIAGRYWPLDALSSGYAEFLTIFAPLQSCSGLPPEQAILARVLLVHEFRRIVLKDPFMPASALPQDWRGPEARDMFERIHRSLSPDAAIWLDREVSAT